MVKSMMKIAVVFGIASCFVTPAFAQTTNAANVSAGTFGANTGGGTYTFGSSSILRVDVTTPLSTGDKLIVNSGMSIQRFGFGNAPNATFTYARGTESAPTAAGNGDETGRFLFRAYDGAGVVPAARFGAVVDGAVASGSVPLAIVFRAGNTFANSLERFRIGSDGRIFIGGFTTADAATGKTLFVTGNAHVTGTLTGGSISATYQDIAEWVPSSTDLEPGTVVSLHPSRSNEVVAASKAYDTSVAGVVSAQPGISLGIAAPDREQVATTGRVHVKVDATKGAIRIGDLLVASDRPGIAMKSVPVEIGGVAMHRPGTLIGKALEPLENGEGRILVLLSMQ